MAVDSRAARQWRVFFAVVGGVAVLVIGATLWATYEFQRSLPPDCSACGMGAVGLVPLYLASGALVLTLFVAALVWCSRLVQGRAASPMRPR